ncbi:MAG TPA: hypothetical protein VLT32_21060 [Candidatus Sulfomarinibacteraceae bacterium]|nr:hypothetical protein [Candidatus Sulfomarinibacteraceae bacterium]
MRRLKIIAAAALATVAAVAIGLWLLRDQPRRIVQAALAERLDADVSIGSLRIDGLSAVRLGGIRVRMHTAPGLREVRVAEIEAGGTLRDMAGGRFRSLRLIGVEIVLDPAAGAVWPTAAAAATSPEAARLEIVDGRLTLLSPKGDSVVELSAELNDLGLVPTGTLSFTSDRLQLDPLIRLAGLNFPGGELQVHAEGVVGELVVAANDPRLRLSVRAEGVSAAGQPALTVGTIEGTVVEETPGVFHVEVVPSLPSVAEARFEAKVVASPWRVTWLHMSANGVDAGPWSLLASPRPRQWSVTGGTVDLEVAGEPARGLAFGLAAHDLDVEGPFPIRGDLAGKGEVRTADSGAPSGRFELTGRLARPPSETVPNTMLDAVLPATLAASVDLTAGGGPVSGTVELATAAAGDLHVTGTAGLGAAGPLDARWSWSGGDLGRLLETFAPNAAAAIPGGPVATGAVAARGRLGGDLGSPTVDGQVEVRDLAVLPHGAPGRGVSAWRLDGESGVARFAWSSPDPAIEIDVPETQLTVAVDPLDPVRLSVHGAAAVDVAGGGTRIRQVVVDAGGLGTARFEADWQSTTAASARLAARVDDLGGWLELAAPVLGDAVRSARATGRATIEVEATRDGAGWSFGGPIEVAGAGLNAAGGSRVLEGLAASAILKGVAGPDGRLRANAVATLGGFQLLWGTHYADFSDRHAVVTVDANRSPDGDAAVEVQLELPPQAALVASLRFTGEAPPAWMGSLRVDDIGGFWERYAGVPFQGTLGVAGALRVEGGELRARLRGTVDAVVTATGEVALEGLSLSAPDNGFSLENLRLQLPVDLGWSDAGGVQAGEPQRGSLAFDRAAVGGVHLAATATELVVLGDSVTMAGDLDLPVLGGEVVLENAGLADLSRPSRHLTAAVGLRRISLAEVSRALGLPPLEGDVTGRFPRVQYGNGVLKVDGTGELSIFGGTVTMSGITGSDLLTRYPRLKFSAAWQEIDLAQVTRTFDFGTMTGIVEGELVDCEIFRDVPVRFRGRLQSVPHKGVKQRISLKAVNNIAIVGTGSGLGFLDSGLRRFIDSYAYRGIGIEMALSQDRFLLRGLERRGDRELFVKGRFPLRLDVVNVDPGMTVSFRTMIQRLGTLDVTTVTTQP